MVPGAECSVCINRSDFFTSLTVLKIDEFHLKGAVKSDKYNYVGVIKYKITVII